MGWSLLLALAVLSAPSVRMDSITDEVTGGSTQQPGARSRSGFVSNHLAATLAIDDQWLLGASYTLSLNTGVGLTHTPSLDATYVANEHISASVAIDGTPPVHTFFPLCLGRLGLVCLPVDERIWSMGGLALFNWDSAGSSNFEWGVDGGYAPRGYDLRYSLLSGPRAGQGLSERLQQHRFSVGATGHLFKVVDVDVRGSYYFYAGSLDILQRPVIQLAGGLPIAPRMFETAASVTAFFLKRKLSAKVGFLFAPYADRCLGSAGQLQAKVSGTIGSFRLWGSFLFQADRPPTGTATVAACTEQYQRALNSTFSSYASVGAEYDF